MLMIPELWSNNTDKMEVSDQNRHNQTRCTLNESDLRRIYGQCCQVTYKNRHSTTRKPITLNSD